MCRVVRYCLVALTVMEFNCVGQPPGPGITCYNNEFHLDHSRPWNEQWFRVAFIRTRECQLDECQLDEIIDMVRVNYPNMREGPYSMGVDFVVWIGGRMPLCWGEAFANQRFALVYTEEITDDLGWGDTPLVVMANVFCHELGHLLGQDHTFNPTKFMADGQILMGHPVPVLLDP